VQDVCVAVEGLTIIVWVQVTGTVSSYFLLMGPVAILGYRFFLGYRVGVVIALSFAISHVAAYVLETLGVLPIASLFVRDPGGSFAASRLLRRSGRHGPSPMEAIVLR